MGQEHPGQGDVLEFAQVAKGRPRRTGPAPVPSRGLHPTYPARPTPVPSTPLQDAHWGKSHSHTGALPRGAGRARRPDLLVPPVFEPLRRASDTGFAGTQCARPAPCFSAGAAWRHADRYAHGRARSFPRTCLPFPAVSGSPCSVASCNPCS